MVDAASQSTTRPAEAVKTTPSHFDLKTTRRGPRGSQNKHVPF